MTTAPGAAELQGNAKTSHEEATLLSGFAGCTQLNVAELKVKDGADKVVGVAHEGGGAQVTLAIQPAAVVAAFEVNTQVKFPDGCEEVKAGGIVVPDKVANNGKVAFGPS